MTTEKFIFIDPDGNKHEHEIITGVHLHDHLTHEQVSRVYAIQEALQEAYPKSVIDWIDGFLTDVDPEVELQIIEALIKLYQGLAKKVKLTLTEKQSLWAILCIVSMGGDVTVQKATRKAGLEKRLPRPAKLKKMWVEASKNIPPKDYSTYSKLGPGHLFGPFRVE